MGTTGEGHELETQLGALARTRIRDTVGEASWERRCSLGWRQRLGMRVGNMLGHKVRARRKVGWGRKVGASDGEAG